jgi:hypothetical protein
VIVVEVLGAELCNWVWPPRGPLPCPADILAGVGVILLLEEVIVVAFNGALSGRCGVVSNQGEE